MAEYWAYFGVVIVLLAWATAGARSDFLRIIRNLGGVVGVVGAVGLLVFSRFNFQLMTNLCAWILFYGMTFGLIAGKYLDIEPRRIDGLFGVERWLRVPGEGLSLSDRSIGVAVAGFMLLVFGVVLILVVGMPLIIIWSLRPHLDELPATVGGSELSVDVETLSSALKFYAVGASAAMAIPALFAFLLAVIAHAVVVRNNKAIGSAINNVASLRSSGWSMLFPATAVSFAAFLVVKYGDSSELSSSVVDDGLSGDAKGGFEISFDDWQLVVILAAGMVLTFGLVRISFRVWGGVFEGYYAAALVVVVGIEAAVLWALMRIDPVRWMLDVGEIRGRQLVLEVMGFSELVPNLLVLSVIIFSVIAGLMEMRSFVRSGGVDSSDLP